MHKIIYASLATVLLASCGGNTDTAADTDTEVAATDETQNMAPADTDADATAPAEMPATDAATYAAKAGAGDMWEIESSKALLAKSTNAGTKKFAQMMVDNHSKSTEKVKAAAANAKLTLTPPKLDAMQQKMLDEIKAADAAGIDKIYIAHQKTAHQAALALHEGYAANGDTPAFKTAAAEIAPVVKKHIAELDKMPAM